MLNDIAKMFIENYLTSRYPKSYYFVRRYWRKLIIGFAVVLIVYGIGGTIWLMLSK